MVPSSSCEGTRDVMTNHLAATKLLVKPHVDESFSRLKIARYAAGVSSEDVARRIEEVRRLRGLSARALAEKAGLKSPGHVSTMLHSLNRPDKKKPNLVDTLEAIARGGGVSFAWLLTGEGARESSAAGINDRADRLGGIGQLEKMSGVAASAIEHVRRHPPFGFARSAPPAFWVQLGLLYTNWADLDVPLPANDAADTSTRGDALAAEAAKAAAAKLLAEQKEKPKPKRRGDGTKKS